MLHASGTAPIVCRAVDGVRCASDSAGQSSHDSPPSRDGEDAYLEKDVPLENQTVRRMKERPVRTSEELPFERLEKMYHVVRERSAARVVLEKSVPLHVLERMSEKYGDELSSLKRTTGAEIQIKEPNSVRNCSVTLSGSFAQVARVEATIDAFDPEQRETAGSKYTGGRQFPKVSADWLLRYDVKTQSELPSASLGRFAFVLRSRSETEATLECCVPTEAWPALTGKYGEDLQKLGRRSGSFVQVMRATRSSSANEPSMLLTVSGPFEKVAHARDMVLGFRPQSDVPRLRSNESISDQQNRWARIAVPTRAVPILLGVKGRYINQIQRQTSCRIYHEREKGLSVLKPDSAQHFVLSGPPAAVDAAHSIIQAQVSEKCLEEDVPDFECKQVAGDFGPAPAEFEHSNRWATIAVPTRAVPILLGARGTHINQIQKQTRCTIYSRRTKDPSALKPDELQYFVLSGPATAVDAAHSTIQDLVSEKCLADDVDLFECREVASGFGPAPARDWRQLKIDPTSLRTSQLGSTTAVTPNDSQKPRDVLPATPNIARATLNTAPATPDTARATPSTAPIDPVLLNSLKATLRTMAHPVVLITSQATYPSETLGFEALSEYFRGVTVSSFNTVTLSPRPIVSFNIRIPSRTYDAIIARASFRAHILASTEKGAQIADAFTKPYDQPYQPFRELKKAGVHSVYFSRARKPYAPKLVSPSGGILACLDCEILTDRCVTVEDHVVILAEVTKLSDVQPGVMDAEDVELATALSYSQRTYRGIGPAIEVPQLLETSEATTGQVADTRVSSDDTEVDEETVANTDHAPEDDLGFEEDMHRGDGVGYSLDYFQMAKASAHDAVSNEPDPDVTQLPESESLEAEVGSPKALPDREDEDMSESQPSEDTKSTVQAADTNARSQSPSTPTHGTASKWGTEPWGVQSSTRAFSTLSRRPLLCKDGHGMMAAYITRASSYTATPASCKPRQPSDEDMTSVDPSVLRQTVGDFLGTNRQVRPQRMRRMARSKKTAEEAAKKLQRMFESGNVDLEERAYLESTISSNERMITKKLALRAAKSLRVMLDTGRVDARAAQHLEMAIEKGQSIVLGEARKLREMIDGGQVDEEQARILKEALTKEHNTLTEETRRLQGLIEDGELDMDQPTRDPASFDGFRGNV